MVACTAVSRYGSLGMVFRGVNVDTGESIAIKELHFDPDQHSQLRKMQQEVEMMRGLEHPHIVKYLGVEEMTVDQASCKLLIFSEWVAGGSVQAMLERFSFPCVYPCKTTEPL